MSMYSSYEKDGNDYSSKVFIGHRYVPYGIQNSGGERRTCTTHFLNSARQALSTF